MLYGSQHIFFNPVPQTKIKTALVYGNDALYEATQKWASPRN